MKRCWLQPILTSLSMLLWINCTAPQWSVYVVVVGAVVVLQTQDRGEKGRPWWGGGCWCVIVGRAVCVVLWLRRRRCVGWAQGEAQKKSNYKYKGTWDIGPVEVPLLRSSRRTHTGEGGLGHNPGVVGVTGGARNIRSERPARACPDPSPGRFSSIRLLSTAIRLPQRTARGYLRPRGHCKLNRRYKHTRHRRDAD